MTCPRPFAAALLATALASAPPPTARADSATPGRNELNPPADPAVAQAAVAPGRSFLVPGRSSSRSSSGSAGETTAGPWWLGPAGIAAALAGVGALSWAARRFNLNLGSRTNPARAVSRLGVVGSVRLGPKQALHLVRVGDRVLIIGTGPGSAPQTLGEVDDPAELARLAPRRATPTAPSPRPSAGTSPSARLDRRIGDDE